MQCPAGRDGGDGVVEGPGEGEEESEAPDDGQPLVAVTELRPDM